MVLSWAVLIRGQLWQCGWDRPGGSEVCRDEMCNLSRWISWRARSSAVDADVCHPHSLFMQNTIYHKHTYDINTHTRSYTDSTNTTTSSKVQQQQRQAKRTWDHVIMVPLWNRADHYIFMLWFLSSICLFCLAESQRPHIGCLPYFHTWCGLSANLDCRSEMCGTRLAENAGPKKVAKNRHLSTIAQLCRAIFAIKACIDNRKKLVKQQYVLKMSPQYGEHRPTNGWDRSVVWGTPANFNGFRILAVLLHGSQVVSVRQTLRRWTEGATYVRQGDHHVELWPTFLVVLRTIWLPLSAV